MERTVGNAIPEGDFCPIEGDQEMLHQPDYEMGTRYSERIDEFYALKSRAPENKIQAAGRKYGCMGEILIGPVTTCIGLGIGSNHHKPSAFLRRFVRIARRASIISAFSICSTT